MTDMLLIFLGLLLLIIAISVVRSSSLLSSVILMSAFSITLSACFVLIAAIDVAITEAVVGAGFLTALYLVAISKTRGIE